MTYTIIPIVIIPLVFIIFIWYVFKNDPKNDDLKLNIEFDFSNEDKLFVPAITAETTQDRQNIFNDSFIRYKRNFNAKLQENQRQTQMVVEEKSEIISIKKEAIQIVDTIQEKKRKGILGVLTQIVEETKDPKS